MPQLHREAIPSSLNRRSFLQLAGVTALDLPFARWFEEWRALGHRPHSSALTPFITANKDFYLVAVNPSFRPSFDAKTVDSSWSLKLQGVNGQSRNLGYRELLDRATRKVFYTFECIGNSVGGQLIGNAQWHVIPLKELVSKAPGATQDAHSVMFVGLDDFHSSVSLQRALDDYAFLALQMNGAPLPAEHGFPARVILPDLYGMKQPRWLRSITLQQTSQTTSYWEERGWAGEVPVKTMARLDPRGDLPGAQPEELTGVAFAGRRGISKVEISLDAGQTWDECELVTPESTDVWSLWRYRWPTPTASRHTIEVRATDGTGALQTAQQHGSFPDGASGLDTESVRVVARS
jgi:DMSO/TMAO reductase YedYZ molybdopterin-dependent catalytic subunit